MFRRTQFYVLEFAAASMTVFCWLWKPWVCKFHNALDSWCITLRSVNTPLTDQQWQHLLHTYQSKACISICLYLQAAVFPHVLLCYLQTCLLWDNPTVPVLCWNKLWNQKEKCEHYNTARNTYQPQKSALPAILIPTLKSSAVSNLDALSWRENHLLLI